MSTSNGQTAGDELLAGPETGSALYLAGVCFVASLGGLLRTSLQIVLASLEHGWDEQYGGIRYITNVDWTPTHSLEADMKLWWPHGEALYALLLAWDLTGRDDVGMFVQATCSPDACAS